MSSLGISYSLQSAPKTTSGGGSTLASSNLFGGGTTTQQSPLNSIINSFTPQQTSGSIPMINGTPQKGAATTSTATPLAPPPTAPGLPGPINNTSQVNPMVQSILDTLKGRADGDMGAGTAIRLAQGSTRDMLSGMLKELGQNATRRGVAGSGAETMAQGNLAGQAQRNMAGQSAQIAYGAEQDRNALLSGTANLAMGSDQSQRADRGLALQQWEAQQQAAQQAYQSQLAAWNYNQQNQLQQQRMEIDRTNNLLNILRTPLF